MGLVEKYRQFKKRRLKKAIAGNLKVVQNPKAIKEERAAAIDFFKHLDNPETAINALLSRFSYSLEHGINDTREKESCMEGILRFNKEALPFVEKHLKSSTKIAWPIKVLKAIASDSEVVATLSSCLDFGDVSFNQSQIDKNYDLLCYLREYQLDTYICEKLLHFLNEHDERVRFAVVEVLLEQKHLLVPKELEKLLLDDSPENSRIRQSIIDAFVNNKWQLSNRNQFKIGPFLPGVKVDDSFRLIAT